MIPLSYVYPFFLLIRCPVASSEHIQTLYLYLVNNLVDWLCFLFLMGQLIMHYAVVMSEVFDTAVYDMDESHSLVRRSATADVAG